MLNYTLPDLPPGYYAENALTVLRDLADKMPGSLTVMLRSDVLLTISGVRAQATYINFPGLANQQLQQLAGVLRNHGIDLFAVLSVVVELADNENWFINHRGAVADLPERYAVDVFPVLKTPLRTFDSFSVWSSYVESQLINLMEAQKKDFNSELLQNLRTPHNIRSGMLLGFPGEAIISGQSLSETDLEIQADIKFRDVYDAAWPVYLFGEELKNNPNIVNHQHLWSEILRLIYDSEWHKEFVLTLEAEEALS